MHPADGPTWRSFEAESPAALNATTRYLYVVVALAEVSVYVVLFASALLIVV